MSMTSDSLTSVMAREETSMCCGAASALSIAVDEGCGCESRQYAAAGGLHSTEFTTGPARRMPAPVRRAALAATGKIPVATVPTGIFPAGSHEVRLVSGLGDLIVAVVFFVTIVECACSRSCDAADHCSRSAADERSGYRSARRSDAHPLQRLHMPAVPDVTRAAVMRPAVMMARD